MDSRNRAERDQVGLFISRTRVIRRIDLLHDRGGKKNGTTVPRLGTEVSPSLVVQPHLAPRAGRTILLGMETFHRTFFRNSADLSFLEPESIDLVVTSPPYPMIAMWDVLFGSLDARVASALDAADGPAAFELMHGSLDAVWAECFRVLKPGAFACINIGDATRTIGGDFRLYTNHARITSRCESIGFQSLPAVLWRKQTNAPNKFMGSGMLPAGAYVTLEHEYVLVLRKGGKKSFEGAEREARRKSAFFWEERNVWFSDLWDFKGAKQDLAEDDARKRSAAFPFELAFRLVNMYSLRGGLVLDPFLGTGTVMLAAIASARNSVGVEIDEGLAPAIEREVLAFANIADERQARRLAEHEAFVAECREKRGRVLGHRNEAHGFPVMTGQETELELPSTGKIARTGKAEFRATHGRFEPPARSAETEGF